VYRVIIYDFKDPLDIAGDPSINPRTSAFRAAETNDSKLHVPQLTINGSLVDQWTSRVAHTGVPDGMSCTDLALGGPHPKSVIAIG